MTRLELEARCAQSLKESSAPSSRPSSRWSAEERLQSILLLIAVLFAVLALAYATGCTRTILVPEAAPIRIGPDARIKVYAVDPETKEWRLSDERVVVPEGWYAVPPSFVENPDA